MQFISCGASCNAVAARELVWYLRHHVTGLRHGHEVSSAEGCRPRGLNQLESKGTCFNYNIPVNESDT